MDQLKNKTISSQDFVYEKKEYVTVEDGVDFRTIAKDISQHGYPMNHATARNIVFEALKTVASDLVEKNIQTYPSVQQLESIVNSRYFQESLPEFLYMIYEERIVENNKNKQAVTEKKST